MTTKTKTTCRRMLIVIEFKGADDEHEKAFDVIDDLLDVAALQEPIEEALHANGVQLEIEAIGTEHDREEMLRCKVCGDLGAGAACCPPCDEPKCFDGVVIATITPASAEAFGGYEVQRCERCQKFSNNGEAAAFLAQFIGRDVI